MKLRMMFFLLALGLLPKTVLAQQEAEDKTADPVVAEIESLLTVQADCWNEEDIEGFMGTYWNSAELTFSSGGKTTRGWQATLEGYKKRYPAGNMGKLNFDHLETTILNEGVALVLGQWHLKYDDQNKDGNFSLVLRKMDDGWKIVHDHSSIIEPVETKEEI
jgi:ketosteroid isomerase-like protein